ncbi:MAG: LysR family transcriptional regulator [Inhella sp.]|jgi:DNA-binding transcriptional LysR family regulator|uniref:LysR family transcriptional regulator n=1 Tax=Inhella sp. TaxID=1921806 RepID=UPI0022BDD362|nr:LysR family transcriptional regulator [Inhella sp.]MCZ8236716.1 LysR family transcriptional regulator [Inhella sp.]
MESIDPTLARLFLTLAEELHFGRTAERLGWRQPQVSKGLRHLESCLGVPLLNRTSRRVRLTAAGEALREPLRDWLHQGQGLALVARAAAQGQRGQLRVGMVSPAGFGPLPSWLHAFQVAHPGVALELREATLDVQLDGLQRGSLDLGWVLQPAGAPPPPLGWRALAEEPFVLAVSQPAACRLGPEPAVDALLTEPLVLFPRDIAPALHDAVVDYYRAHGVIVQPRQRAVQMATLIHLASADFGLAWVPASMQALQRPGVLYLDAPPDAPRCQTWVLATPALGPVARAFLQGLPSAG